jgi:hypothetical protein
LREEWRRAHVVFEEIAPESELRVEGVSRVAVDGRTASLLVTRGLPSVLERVDRLGGTVTDVHPVSLKEIFLESLKEG